MSSSKNLRNWIISFLPARGDNRRRAEFSFEGRQANEEEGKPENLR